MPEKPVEAAPQTEAPRITIPTKDIEATVGETIKFFCKATGVPKPDFVWLKDDQEISPTNSEFIIEYTENVETTLTIPNVQPEHDATYTCKAVNPAGSDSCKAELFVKGRNGQKPFTPMTQKFYFSHIFNAIKFN